MTEVQFGNQGYSIESCTPFQLEYATLPEGVFFHT